MKARPNAKSHRHDKRTQHWVDKPKAPRYWKTSQDAKAKAHEARKEALRKENERLGSTSLKDIIK